MEIFVFCPRRSQGVLELTRELGATRLRQFDGIDFWDRRQRISPADGDIVVNFSDDLPAMDGLKVLNASDGSHNRYVDLSRLVYTVGSCVRVVPAEYANEPDGCYMRRRNQRIGPHDLLSPPERWDYCAVREDFDAEFRLHVFGGKVIRIGEKVVREGFTLVEDAKDWKPNTNLVHPWVRIHEAGWTVLYDGAKATAAIKKVATLAVSALGLMFASVDIGITGGQPKLFKINRQPIMDEVTVSLYARAIHNWIMEKAHEGVANPAEVGAAVAGGEGEADL